MSALHGKVVNVYEVTSLNKFKFFGTFTSAIKAGAALNLSGSTVIRYLNTDKLFKNKSRPEGLCPVGRLWAKYTY